MRIIRLMLLLATSIAAGCASMSTGPPPAQPRTVTTHDEACGNPTRWPVSQECVAFWGYPRGSLLQRKSDLLMAVWRECPSADPCIAVSNSTPACKQSRTLESRTAEFEDARSKCTQAQATDYSCNAIQKEPEYYRRDEVFFDCLKKSSNDPTCAGPGKDERPGTKHWDLAMKLADECLSRCPAPDDSRRECQRAQAALTDFQDRVQKAMLDAQLKEAFAPPQPILIPPPPPERPIIIQQQAPAPNYFAPPVLSPPVFTNCTNFGSTTNCISH